MFIDQDQVSLLLDVLGKALSTQAIGMFSDEDIRDIRSLIVELEAEEDEAFMFEDDDELLDDDDDYWDDDEDDDLDDEESDIPY